MIGLKSPVVNLVPNPLFSAFFPETIESLDDEEEDEEVEVVSGAEGSEEMTKSEEEKELESF